MAKPYSLCALLICSVFTSLSLKSEIPRKFSDGFSENFDEQIIDDISQFSNEPNFVGGFVGVIDGDNEGLACLGYADTDRGIPVTDETLFEIGSISKVFTGILLAHAIDEGELSLDMEVADLLSEKGDFSNLGSITLKDLVTHTSGLPRIVMSPEALQAMNGLLIQNRNPYGYYTPDLVLDYLKTVDPTEEYGKYDYSNLGVGLVGYILSQTYGKPYEELLRNYILNPYHMDDSCVLVPESKQFRFAVGYMEVEKFQDETKPVYKSSAHWELPEVIVGAGGIRSTGKDMMQFLRHCLQGDDPAVNESLKVLYHGPMDMGMCWHIIHLDNKPVYFHNGGTGGFRCCLLFNREMNVGAFILTNSLIAPEVCNQLIMRRLMLTEMPDVT